MKRMLRTVILCIVAAMIVFQPAAAGAEVRRMSETETAPASEENAPERTAILRAAVIVAAGGALGIVLVNRLDDGGGAGTGARPASPEREFDSQYGLEAVNARFAHIRGLTGAGSVVAVIDSGLDTTHPEFEGRVAPGAVNYLEDQGPGDVSDGDGHGTHVTGIIAANQNAEGMFGVAYESRILPIRIIDDVEGNTTENLVAAVKHAVAQNADVINGSYGPLFFSDLPAHPIIAADAAEAGAYIEAARQGVVLVFAAGNDGELLPNLSRNPTGAGLYPYVRPANAGSGVYDDGGAGYDFSELEGSLIAVVAVNERNEIAGFSNRAGVAADWTLAAPGVEIYSTLPLDQGGYGRISGTSQAAPHVSGAVAVLRQLFPHLSGRQIVDILLRTATDIGPRVVYGHGLLDLEAATRPVGEATVPTGTSVADAAAPLTQTRIALGAAFGDALRGTDRRIAFLDAYDRAYLLDMGAFLGPDAGAFSFRDAVLEFSRPRARRRLTAGKGTSLAFSGPTEDIWDPSAHRGERDGIGSFSLTHRLAGAGSVTVNLHRDPREAFGLYGEGALVPGDAVYADALGAPYLGFGEDGVNAHFTAQSGAGVSWRAGAFRGSSGAADDPVESFGTASELRFSWGERAAVGVQVGALFEEETFLGSAADGAFATEDGIPTYFAGVTASFGLGERLRMVAGLHQGLSFPEPAGRSLLTDVGTIRSEAYSLGLVAGGLFGPADRAGVTISQPLRVSGGAAEFTVPVGRDLFGNLYRETFEADLAPKGREIAVQAFYHTPVGDRAALGAGLIYRHEPGHSEGSDADFGGMLRWSMRF